MGAGPVYAFDRDGAGWREWTSHGAEPLQRLLELDAQPPEGAVLLAPLGTRDGPLGFLKLSALSAGTFGRWELDALESFTPLAAQVIQRSQAEQAMYERVVGAERKHAIADLARGVAHDVNNALGAVLPLVQQMRSRRSPSGRIVADRCARTSSRSSSRCRCAGASSAGCCASRAARQARRPGRRAARDESTMAVLPDSLKRQGVEARARGPTSAAAGRRPAERPRAGVPQPRDQRARGDAAGRRRCASAPASTATTSRSPSPTPAAASRRTC